ncbi:MAG: flagellar motor protein MotD, partial [Proteobacteria bacterium]|nr:flagellar motor protein MotD [Pseudomonadota bacterium]
MARRRHSHAEHVNHEAWAIPYGDLVTLLLAFFVVMYAISSVNEGKYRMIADALSSAFGGPPRTITPVQLGATQLRGSSFDRPSMQTAAAKAGPAPVNPIANLRVRQMLDMPSFGRRSASEERAATAAAHTASEIVGRDTVQLQTLGQRIQDALSELVRQKLVTVRRGATFLEVEIQSDILFASGVAVPNAFATSTVRRLAAVLHGEGAAELGFDHAVRRDYRPPPSPLRAARHASTAGSGGGRGVHRSCGSTK